MKRFMLATLVATAAIIGTPVAFAADPVPLKFAFIGTQNSPLGRAVSRWAEAVTKDSGGEAEVRIFWGPALGGLNVIYDRLVDGAVEIAFAVLAETGTRYTESTVAGLPFEARNSKEAGTALWRLYERGMLADDFAKVRPLAVMIFGNQLHSSKPVKNLDDLRGLKVAVQSRLAARVVPTLGAAAVSTTVNEMYQSLSRKGVDATLVGWSAVASFKLAEVTSVHVDESLLGGPAFIGMNRGTYERLPARTRAAVDRYSGKTFTEWAGEASDEADNEARRALQARPNQEVVTLAPAEQARWREKLRPLIDDWVKTTPNGANILAAFRDEIKKLREAK